MVTLLVRNQYDVVQGALSIYCPKDEDLSWFARFLKAVALVDALGAYDFYTKNHSRNVAYCSAAIAKKLGLSKEDVQNVALAAILHDIGKISVPVRILTKPGPLNEKEFAEIKKHPEQGVVILKELGLFQEITPAILHHHERYGGGGYPFGIGGEEINLLARIIAVADAFDAMTSDRPYRKAMTREEAVREILRSEGQFDPGVVACFLGILG
ncbi:MAG: HD-GYP domain-containing protein [Bacillota bacterium]